MFLKGLVCEAQPPRELKCEVARSAFQAGNFRYNTVHKGYVKIIKAPEGKQ